MATDEELRAESRESALIVVGRTGSRTAKFEEMDRMLGAGFSLLRAGGFSCGLDFLHGVLRINKYCNFFDKNWNFIFNCKILTNFVIQSIDPELDPVPH